MIEQISIFAENRKGAMHHITSVLREADINITALITNDSAEFGIVRMLVSDPARAKDALTAAGYLCHTDRVIGVLISDDTGSLDALLDDILRGNINVDYLYISYDRQSAMPIALLHAPDSAEVEALLASRGYQLL